MNASRSAGTFYLLAWFAFAVLPLGCAGSGGPLTQKFDLSGVKQAMGISQYYIRSRTAVWTSPDRSSAVVGRLSQNARVTETDRNERGWSKVKAADGGLEGWVPTAALWVEPVQPGSRKTERATVKPSGRTTKPDEKQPVEVQQQQPQPVETEQTQEEASQEPAGQTGGEARQEATPAPSEKKSDEGTAQKETAKPAETSGQGSLLGPSPASAAPAPKEPTTYQPPAERKGKPEIFEPF